MNQICAIFIGCLHMVVVSTSPLTTSLSKLPLQITSSNEPDIRLSKRTARSSGGQIGCTHMESFPGEYQYVSDGTSAVCGLYLIGQPDQIVQVTFEDLNVNCHTGGAVAFFDGWELQHELFPSEFDHPLGFNERYHMFCNGGAVPMKMFTSSQNVAMLHFLVKEVGEGFKIKVNFLPSPQPCNAVAMLEFGTLTMKNYGLRRNCSVSIIYPEQIQLVNVDVGVTSESSVYEAEVGLSDKQCLKYGGGDYVQLLNGNGLDTTIMRTKGILCGMDSKNEKEANFVLSCQHSVVRMVSSGEFHNTVTFMYAPPAESQPGTC
ncbi:corticotropin-releasing factor-binding protein-like isoform X1 [Dreissena polymorpha]|uniref:corticotropin-releasing factor-binding protein-like isoform X1 n=1 Tax=Dreissena polymorpha TaxID=45954 RepID=UPI002263E79A|nr:corticotropin-releasing factor-binding protein-like isoform X1 [Dreissena polymorpha]